MSESTIFTKKLFVDGEEIFPPAPPPSYPVVRGTPVIEFETSTDISLTSSVCDYQIVGDCVHFNIRIAYSSLGTSSGDLALELPSEVLGTFREFQHIQFSGAYDYVVPANFEFGSAIFGTRLIRGEISTAGVNAPIGAGTMKSSSVIYCSGSVFLE